MDVDKEEPMVFHSLEDWCEYMLKLRNSKAIYKSVPLMSRTAQRDKERFIGHDTITKKTTRPMCKDLDAVVVESGQVTWCFTPLKIAFG